MALHDNLKRIREERKLTKKELCEKTGISERAYLTYEFGEREPKVGVIEKLADFYGVTTDYLLGRESKKDLESDFDPKQIGTTINTVIKGFKTLTPDGLAFICEILSTILDAAQYRLQSDKEDQKETKAEADEDAI